jgi:hypothetical protein
VFGPRHGDVRMVVLNRHSRHAESPRQRLGQAGAVEVGMQVMRHRLQRRGCARQQRIERIGQRAAGRSIAQVAMQGRPAHLVAIEQAGAVLQVGAAGQHRGRRGARQRLRLHAG